MTTSFTRREALKRLSWLAPLPAFCGPAAAADKVLRLIVPLDAGSTPDSVARALGTAISKTSGDAVVVENLPGAGGTIGASQLVRAAKDGNTLALVASNHVITPSLYRNVPYEAIKDVTPLTLIASSPFVFVVHRSVPANNLQDLIKLAKASPGHLAYGSSGIGTAFHLAGALLESQAGIQLAHVAYKGTSPMVNDLLGGQVQMAFVGLPVIAPHIASGAVKAIGVTSATRFSAAPQIPSFAEQGLTDYSIDAWMAVIGPAGLPAPVAAKRHAEVTAAAALPEFRDWLTSQGFTPLRTSMDATRQVFQADQAKYAELVRRTGARAD